MASNHKLTAVLKGRTIRTAQSQGDQLVIGFDDGSEMTVHTAGPAASPTTGGTVKAVRQQDTALHLDLGDGSSLEIRTAEPTSSVMVRDKANKMEYAD